MDKKLYYRIDEDEELTDAEKREIYNAEIADREAEQEWQDDHD